MGKYFGTDGFRGEANVNLTSEHAYKIGKFIGWYYGARLGRRARVVIGKDTRRSSYMFEITLIVNKRVQNSILGCNLKNDRVISVCFQAKPFNITVIQVYAPTSNAKEAEVEQFYEDYKTLEN